MPAGRRLGALLAPVAALLLALPADWAAQQTTRPSTGGELYHWACAACHGAGGTGASRETVGFDLPLPDFRDCNFTAREHDKDWSAIVHDGGPARGFSPIMPSFGEALSEDEIQRILGYVRGFCAERAWPRGELNLPRPLVTEKAFPEDEAVITTVINAEGPAAVSHKITYEKRIRARNQVEVSAPFAYRNRPQGAWAGGVGDLSLAFKRVLAHSLRTGSIVSATAETVLPTGDSARGFGKGVTVLEFFGAYGQALPSDSFVQIQGGIEAPTRPSEAPRAAFWRTAAGRSFAQKNGFGRTWSPMVELLADRDFETGAKTNWDVVPQLQVTLSTRQHIMASFGVRAPVNNTAARPVQFMFYLLWDWFDGGLREGW